MIKASDIGIEVQKRNGKPFVNRVFYTSAISIELRRRGIPHSSAHYDESGNCLTCGECGRCPGVHTFEEIQQAARKASA